MIEPYAIIITVFGFAIVLMAFLPMLSKKLKVSFTIPLFILGCILFLSAMQFPWPDPADWPWHWTKFFTELIVVISLMGAGLKIGNHYTLNEWKGPFRLVFITMPLCMLGVFLVSFYLLGFSGPASLLLAAVLAPTDPVLASELQLEELQDLENKNTGMRFTLTAEAGINDGLAFPFVYLAILWSESSSFTSVDFFEWTTFYVIFKIIGGIIIGGLVGWLFSLSIEKMTKKIQSEILNGFIAVALTLFSYGIAEIASTYGFISVFFTGIFIQYYRTKKEDHEPKSQMLLFVEESERLLIVLWTILFGGAIMAGLLKLSTLGDVIFALGFVLVLRPVIGYLSLLGTTFSKAKKWAIGFFGIRGIGSLFYLSYAVLEGNFPGEERLLGLVAYVLIFSLFIHGLTSQRVIDYFNAKNDHD